MDDRIKLLQCTASGWIAVLNDEYRYDGSSVIVAATKADAIGRALMANRWVTINGSHVLIGSDGRIAYGAGGVFNGKKFGTSFNGKKAIKMPKSFSGRRERNIQAHNRAKIMPTKAQESKLKEVARKTKRLAHERFSLVDRDGNVVLNADGGQYSVRLPSNLRGFAYQGCIAIHNHPHKYAGGSFSAADLKQFGYGISEIRVAAREGTYILRNLDHDRRNARKSWVDLRDAYVKARNKWAEEDLNKSRLSEARRLAKEYNDKYVQPIFDKYNARKKAGASTEELQAISKEWEKASSKRTEYIDRTTHIEWAKRLHGWYAENARKYGFEYIFNGEL